MPIGNRIAEFADDMRDWRHWLHRNPEIGFELPKTAGFVAEKLNVFGVDEIHTGIGQTGIVAIINGSAPGPTIGLRADMDALPIHETTGAPYASQTPGAMHACGHDGHTTMLLGAARYLAETRNFAGRVALIFQPAEELGSGAAAMVDEGIMARFDIAEVYGMHTSPVLPVGDFKTCTGPMMAAVAFFDIHIKGLGGHAAYPHKTRDPLAAAVQISGALNTILARNVDPMQSAVISVTQFTSGSAYNVIPDSARLGGTVTPEIETRVVKRIKAVCDGIAAAMEVEVMFDFRQLAPATLNHPVQTDHAVAVAQSIVGPNRATADFVPVMGGEDFSHMLAVCPGAYIKIGQGEGPYLHDPAFDFNDAAAPFGASYFVRLVETRQPAQH